MKRLSQVIIHRRKRPEFAPGIFLIRLLAVAVIGVAALSLGGLLALAQQLDADVDFYAVEPPNGQPFTVGDRIVLRLEVRHPVDSTVELPQLDETWGDFEVIDQTGQDTVRDDSGLAITRKDITVSLFEPGQYQTPPLVVTHRKADQTVEELGAPVIPLKIDSVLIEGDEQLRDLKAQADLPVPPLWPLVLTGVVLAAVASGGLFWAGRWAYNRWLRKEPLELAPVPVIDTRPPEVIAYAELDRIEALNLPARNELKEHYSLVTDCLRRYIEARYQVPALEQTTDELRTAFFRSGHISTQQAREFVDMFARSDLVKFARYRPPTNEGYSLLQEARLAVDKTTPQPEPLPLPGPDAGNGPPPDQDGPAHHPEEVSR